VAAHEIGNLAWIVLAVGVERDHHVGVVGHGGPEAIEQRGGQMVIADVDHVEVEAESLGDVERFQTGGRPAEERCREGDALRLEHAARVVEFGQHRFDRGETVLRRQQDPHEHGRTLSATTCGCDRACYGPVPTVKRVL